MQTVDAQNTLDKDNNKNEVNGAAVEDVEAEADQLIA